jgi:hypothetical protein
VVCREVIEHVPVREIGPLLHHVFALAGDRVYITTRFTADPRHPFDLTTEFDADPSHITLLPQPLIRALCVLNGGVRDYEWEAALDWQHKGRVLVYKVSPDAPEPVRIDSGPCPGWHETEGEDCSDPECPSRARRQAAYANR